MYSVTLCRMPNLHSLSGARSPMSPPPYFEDFLEAASPFVGILYFLWKYGGFRFSVTFSRWQPQVYDNIINLTFPCVSGLNDLLIQAIDMSYQLDIYMILQIIYIYIPLKTKLECGFGFAWWWPVWPPPRQSHSNWGNTCKYAETQLECGAKIGKKM